MEALRRREFTALLGSAALDGPFIARAQQPTMPVIGLLDTSPGTGAKMAAFSEGLKIESFVINQNVVIEYHSAEGDYDRLPRLAADLVNRKVAMIASIGVPAALAAKAATTTIPIVFAIESDPVQFGLIGSLNRPGGNITGVTNMAKEPEQKRLELLHQMIAAATTLALLVNPNNPTVETQTQGASAAARKMGFQVKVLRAIAENDFAAVFAELAESGAGGLTISDDELFVRNNAELAALALRRRVPAIFQHREFVMAGGLMSYGGNLTETYHQAGVYSGLVLLGAKPADLPVYQSTKVEFIINLKTAMSLGLTFPSMLFDDATEVIQ